MYYIYLDSKIKGTYDIVLSYFKNSVFDKEQVTILHRVYKVNTKWTNIFYKERIKVLNIKRWKDLPSLANTTIFYMFNAQSNCRMVSYREATHIFIGHGESNKLASAKPIFRIYDYIAVAGSASIDRFLFQKIFTQCDVENEKFLKVGNKFIGEAPYRYVLNEKTLLYAPTWEGGIEEENYSSLTSSLESFYLIIKYMKKYEYKKIIIQPHPNTGHRDKKYIQYLLAGIELLKNVGFEVYLRPIKLPWISKMRFKGSFLDSSYQENVSVAFCDVSAMEIQLLDKEIPTFVFFTNTTNLVPDNMLTKEYYAIVGIKNYSSKLEVVKKEFLLKMKNYYIEQNKGQSILDMLR